MLKRINRPDEMDLEQCLVEPSYEVTRRKVPLFYKKLVVPMRMRSVYWKYFGFPANDDGTILTREKIVCVICKSPMIYNRNTSNLRMHLHSKHKNVFRKIELEEGEKGVAISNGSPAKRPKPQGKSSIFSRSVDGSVDFNNYTASARKSNDNKDVQMVMTEEVTESDISNIAIIFPNNEELTEYNEVRHVQTETIDSTEITDAIVNFIVTDLAPTSVVDGKGFHNLMSTVCSKTVLLPNEKKLVEELVPTLYNSCKEQVYNTIISSCVSNISISVEDWKSVDGLQCVSIYMHYLQTGEPRLFTKLLTTVYCTGTETIQHWSAVLEKLFDEWSINSSAITGVIVSSDNVELKQALELKNLTILPCFLFVLQKLCTDHCFNHIDVTPVLEKCRRVVKFIQEVKVGVYDTTIANDDEEDFDENDENMLNYDQTDLWLTTYYMLRGLIRRKTTILQILNDAAAQLSGNTLMSSDWEIIQDLINLLEPLKTIVITLFEEKNPSMSLVKPLIWKVNSSRFEIAEDDSPLLQDLKTTMKHFLNEAYSDDTVDNLTQVATTLDPRFKSFVQQDEHFNGGQSLIDLLGNLVETEGSIVAEEPSSTYLKTSYASDFDKFLIICVLSAPGRSSMDKNRRHSGINTLFGSFCVNKPNLTAQDKVKMEVQYYQTATSAMLEECPLEWWQHMSGKCPNLVRLAHKYHCVPAIVIASGTHSIREYINFYFKRASLKINMIDPVLFLHSNRVLF